MKKDRMIKILKDRIQLLQLENEQLKAENGRLIGKIDLISRFDKESLGQAAGLISCLDSKKEEFEGLTGECARLKEEYNLSIKEIQHLMNGYKKDKIKTNMNLFVDRLVHNL